MWQQMDEQYCVSDKNDVWNANWQHVSHTTADSCCIASGHHRTGDVPVVNPPWPGSYQICHHMAVTETEALQLAEDLRMMIGKGFYRKWVKSSFEQFITTQTRVGSTNGRIISQNAEILKFYFSTIFGICDVIKWLRLRGCALSLVLQCVYTVNSR